MTNRRSIVAIVGVVVILAVALAFIRRVRSGAEPSSGLSGSLERVIGDWTANKVPVNSRVVNLIIGVAGPDESLGLGRPLVPDESFFDKLLRWTGLGGGLREAKAPPPPAGPGVVNWTLDSYRKGDEQALVDEVARSIVRLHDAEAELNIVAKGDVGAAVLKSIRSLEGQVRGGVPVGVNRLVVLGMDDRRYRSYDSTAFAQMKRPGNLGEWTNVYNEAGDGLDGSTVEVYSDKADGRKFPGRLLTNLLPVADRASSSGLPVRLDALALGIVGVFSPGGGLETWVTQEQRQMEERLVQARQAEEEARRRVEEEEARRRAEEEARIRAEEEARRRTFTAQMAFLPAGEFLMGSPEGQGNPNEYPQHRVYLDAFYIDRHEVTFGEYRKCVNAGACSGVHASDGKCQTYMRLSWDNPTLPASYQGETQPAVCVDWGQAKTYCLWVGKRLPTEAEWEYAARSGGKDRKYAWGNEDATCVRAVMRMEGVGNDWCGRGSTWPVCSKPAGNTTQGVCDMFGNVDEWLADWHDDSYYSVSPTRNPQGPAGGVRRSVRGSSGVNNQSATSRQGERLERVQGSRGFRCVLPAENRR